MTPRLLSVLLLCATVVHAQQPSEPPAPARLPDRTRFAWPVGTVATVETEYTRDGGIDPAPAISRLRLTHRMRVSPHPQGVLIEYDNHRYRSSSGQLVQALTALLYLWVPGTVVTAEGAFAGIEGADRARDLAAAAFAQEAALAGQAPVNKEWWSSMLSGDGLSGLQRTEWYLLVTQWADRSASEPTVESETMTFLGPGVRAPTKMVLATIGREPCTRASQQLECVTYEIRRTIGAEALEAGRKAAAAATGVEPPVRPLDLETTTRVTLEIGTMLPHMEIQTRTMHGRVDVNGQTATTTDFEERKTTFTYEAR